MGVLPTIGAAPQTLWGGLWASAESGRSDVLHLCWITALFAGALRAPHAFGTSLRFVEALVDAANDAKGMRLFFNTRKGCRKGRKCPQKHVDNDDPDLQLPYTSSYRTKQGEFVFTFRPPLRPSVVAKAHTHKAKITMHTKTSREFGFSPGIRFQHTLIAGKSGMSLPEWCRSHKVYLLMRLWLGPRGMHWKSTSQVTVAL